MISVKPLAAPALALCLPASLALAHAVLTRASLQETPVVVEKATQVTLRFNTAIELGFTKVLLVSAAGEERALEVAPGGDPGTVTVGLPPLPAGAYGLRYKVLAADGHVTESILRFRVSAPE
jgi:hypothetical protein